MAAENKSGEGKPQEKSTSEMGKLHQGKKTSGNRSGHGVEGKAEEASRRLRRAMKCGGNKSRSAIQKKQQHPVNNEKKPGFG